MIFLTFLLAGHSQQISRYSSPQKMIDDFPIFFHEQWGNVEKIGLRNPVGRVRPWWRSWLPSSMRSAERRLGWGWHLTNRKLWWDSLDHGISYIYIYTYTYNLYYIHYVCMYACIHASIHTYIHTYIHASMHTYIHVCSMCSVCEFRSLCLQEVP